VCVSEWVRKRERERVCVCERERQCVCLCMCVCISVRSRERGNMCLRLCFLLWFFARPKRRYDRCVTDIYWCTLQVSLNVFTLPNWRWFRAICRPWNLLFLALYGLFSIWNFHIFGLSSLFRFRPFDSRPFYRGSLKFLIAHIKSVKKVLNEKYFIKVHSNLVKRKSLGREEFVPYSRVCVLLFDLQIMHFTILLFGYYFQ